MHAISIPHFAPSNYILHTRHAKHLQLRTPLLKLTQIPHSPRARRRRQTRLECSNILDNHHWSAVTVHTVCDNLVVSLDAVNLKACQLLHSLLGSVHDTCKCARNGCRRGSGSGWSWCQRRLADALGEQVYGKLSAVRGGWENVMVEESGEVLLRDSADVLCVVIHYIDQSVYVPHSKKGGGKMVTYRAQSPNIR